MTAAGELRLAEQIVRFARVLRAAGVKVGPTSSGSTACRRMSVATAASRLICQ